MNPHPAPRVGVGVIVMRDDRLLLIERRGPHGGGTWSTPGGHLEYGESPHACAAREVREETGLTITGVRFRGITNDVFSATNKHYITIWMEGTPTTGEPVIASPREASAVGWFAWDALPEPLFLPLHHLVRGQLLTTDTPDR